ncbi:MAG: SpoIIE family protein phosphatase, partial [Pseudomonadota bacterium]
MMAKVLVIDDEKIIRDRMTKLLELDDYETFSAENGQKGLEILYKEKPEIALVDIKMPGMDGIEVLKKIKENKEETEVIIITGHGGIDKAIQALKAGAFGYIQKPVDYDELEIEIKRALEKQEMQKRLNEYVHNLEIVNAERESIFQQLRRDYEIAEKVFEKIVQENVHLGCPNIKYLLSPMSTVGGDLILINVGPTGSKYILMGDFTGHGLSAAIGAIPVSGIFYAMTEKGHSIADIATEINLKLRNVLPTGLFLCACLMELNYKKGTFHLWNGGLPDVLIINGGSGIIKKRLPSAHLPLGVVNTSRFDSKVEVAEMAQGDRLYAYTDGILEAVNKQGEMFGKERLEKHFPHNRAPESRFEEICGSLAAFRGDVPQNDDITLMEVRYDIGSLCDIHWKIGKRPEKISSGWNMALELDADDLRNNETVQYLLENLISAERGLLDHREDLYLILSELFFNALDYGI